MQSSVLSLRAIATWSGALAGLMLILAGGLVSAALPLPDLQGPCC